MNLSIKLSIEPERLACDLLDMQFLLLKSNHCRSTSIGQQFAQPLVGQTSIQTTMTTTDLNVTDALKLKTLA